MGISEKRKIWTPGKLPTVGIHYGNFYLLVQNLMIFYDFEVFNILIRPIPSLFNVFNISCNITLVISVLSFEPAKISTH